MQLHPRFRDADVFLRQFGAPFHDPVQQNKHPSRVSEIQDSQLVLKSLSDKSANNSVAAPTACDETLLPPRAQSLWRVQFIGLRPKTRPG